MQPDLLIRPTRRDPVTGKVSASITDLGNGRTYDADVDPETRYGQIVDRRSRAVIGIIDGDEIRPPAAGTLTTGEPDVAPAGGAVPEPVTDDPTAPMAAGDVGETVGDFHIFGQKRLNGDTFEREIYGLYGPPEPGRTTERGVGPLLRLFRFFRTEASEAGATRLRIIGGWIRNPNILELGPVVERYGGTFREIDPMTVEIVVPLPRQGGE